MARAFVRSGSRASAAAAAITLGVCGPKFSLVERVSSGLNGIGALAEIRAYKFVIPFLAVVSAIGE
jgi:hypothetical protein